MKNGTKLLIFTSILLFSTALKAKITPILSNDQTVTLLVEQTNGFPNNTKLSLGKQRNVNSIRMEAINYVGSVVEGRVRMENDELKEESIKILSSAHIRLLEVEHTVTHDNNGALNLTTSAIVKIEKDSIRSNLSRIQRNIKYEKEIRALSEANDDLVRLLKNKPRSNGKDAKEFSINAFSVSDQLNEIDRIKINEKIFESVKRFGKVEIKDLIYSKDKENNYTIDILLGWELDRVNIERYLKENFKSNIKYTPLLDTIKLESPREEKNLLNDYLFNFQFLVKINLRNNDIYGDDDGMVLYFPIAMRATCANSSNCYLIQFSGGKKGQRTVSRHFTNPFEVSNLQARKLSLFEGAEAELVVINEKESSIYHW
ncbi:hypothetical protein [Vibrio coralliilyticus]|uniref:DUF4140 domain-containing protein n=1 Tax=Vibrio coralliilyticus TaxID=190893 RepID=A0AAP7DEK8_9VIBR|nr:hypothetical protein [Vibrio coralliilyticus]NOI31854.1 hypothetical protein [Vibrio coralliilyticus]NOJ25298.1 hypothetical protein [Vibrio coralliilyticus]